MKTLREYIDILEGFSVSQPLSEGVMDRLRRIYMGLVYDTPMGTPDSEFLAQWQREIKAQLGQDIDVDTLARLQQNFRERGQTMMARGDWADYDREMGITEQGVAEGSQTVGHEILGMLRQINRQGDDAMEELYSSCPLLAQFWDQYEGDFRSMVIELSPKTLNRIKAEISAFNQQGVAEGDQELEETQQMEEDPVARIERLAREIQKR